MLVLQQLLRSHAHSLRPWSLGSRGQGNRRSWAELSWRKEKEGSGLVSPRVFFFFFCRGGREKIFVSFGVVVAVFFHSSEKRKNFNLLNLFLDSLESCRASPRPSPPSWPRAPWRRSARAVSRPRGELEAQVRGARCKCAGGEGWDEVVIQEELKARAREQESKRKKERSKREAGGGHSTLTLPIPTLYPHARGAPSCSSLSADPFRHGATRLSVWRGRHGSKGRAG